MNNTIEPENETDFATLIIRDAVKELSKGEVVYCYTEEQASEIVSRVLNKYNLKVLVDKLDWYYCLRVVKI